MVKSIKSILAYIRTHWLLAGVLAVLLAGGTAYAVFHEPAKSVETIPSTSPNQTSDSATKNSSSGSDKTTSSENNSPSSTDSQKDTQASSGTKLIKPGGQFVSNHHASLSGSSEMMGEASVCNTTPGASCSITFSMGSLVKKLETQTADSSGSTYWNWDIKSAGLSQGTWTITATATLNGDSLSAQDSQYLEVQP
jgi:hypothetical protein